MGKSKPASESIRMESGIWNGEWYRCGYRLNRGWIETKEGEEPEKYRIDGRIEDIVNDLRMLGEELAKSANAERVLLFYEKYGPLGFKFRPIFSIDYESLSGRAFVYFNPMMRGSIDLFKYFGQYLKDKDIFTITKGKRDGSSLWDAIKSRAKEPIDAITASILLEELGSKGELSSDFYVLEEKNLFRSYRERVEEAKIAITGFSMAVKNLAEGRTESISGLEEALYFSRHNIEVKGTRPLTLNLTLSPNSLLDAAYIHILQMSLKGGLQICADPKCGKIFSLGENVGRKPLYCSRRCFERHRMEKKRERWRARKELGTQA